MIPSLRKYFTLAASIFRNCVNFELMRNYIFIFFILIILLNTLPSCKKNSTESDRNVVLLTKQSWVLTSIRENTNNNGWVDIFSSLPICEKDNKLFFRADNSFYWDNGLTKCNTSDSQTFYYGTWSFASNETKLSTTGPNGISVEEDIFLLDDTNLITLTKGISGTDTIVNEAKYIH